MAIVSPERCDDGSPVILRPATQADSDMIFAWQSKPGMRRHFHDPRPPTQGEHAAWFAASLQSTERMLNVIEVDRQPAGVLRLDRLSEASERGFLVSILVDPAFEGRGVAKAALRAARRLMAGQRLVAEVLDSNVASRRVFEASGYRPHDGLYVNSGIEHA
jgi:UDP-2,4-diacetamido-2,4,6-trideoxy-beta-L-altropyranose hydrolase